MKIATCVPCFLDQIPHMATIFISHTSFFCGYYSSAATIQGWLLFKGGYYSSEAFLLEACSNDC